MFKWRNWLTRGAYDAEIAGSSPALNINISGDLGGY